MIFGKASAPASLNHDSPGTQETPPRRRTSLKQVRNAIITRLLPLPPTAHIRAPHPPRSNFNPYILARRGAIALHTRVQAVSPGAFPGVLAWRASPARQSLQKTPLLPARLRGVCKEEARRTRANLRLLVSFRRGAMCLPRRGAGDSFSREARKRIPAFLLFFSPSPRFFSGEGAGGWGNMHPANSSAAQEPGTCPHGRRPYPP